MLCLTASKTKELRTDIVQTLISNKLSAQSARGSFASYLLPSGGIFLSITPSPLIRRKSRSATQSHHSKSFCAIIPPRPCLVLFRTLGHKVEERELARVASVLIHKPARQITAKDGSEIVLRHSLRDLVQSDLLQEQLWQCILED